MRNKLTTVDAGFATGYYVNGDYYTEIHENDFTSEVVDVYRSLFSENISEFDDISLSYEQADMLEDYQFPNKLSELMRVVQYTEEEAQ